MPNRESERQNDGRTLVHTAVVRNLLKIGTLRRGQTFSQDVQLKLEVGADPRNLRLIAFLQEPHQGQIVGAALQLVSTR